ncbi:ribosome biogenesis GTPase Der [Pusillimonas sp. CC-YST705]|uniref:GTPase Der n=1 Tax=Mesopusillimonas faecipullorum TaxID=2755040 RepID=A0ABS8CA70_9BURK|nr:ribosome biogenesis GTPase Der [Mesopusillimonas faecipullorum]MCB5362941.1 ribosome biogenesis GTPase Der [Mesopusillimonas faecipullorum]
MKQTTFKPVVALVGRANVGKSTLFNRLTRSRAALVANFPGLTRDRHYGEGRLGDRPYLVVDTGGFEPVAKEGVVVEMARQTQQAIAEADVIIFLVDARAGISAQDHDIAALLRRIGRPVLLAVNKAEGMRHAASVMEFHELGLGEPFAISASHGDGVGELMADALSHLPDVSAAYADQASVLADDEVEQEGNEQEAPAESEEATEEVADHRIKLAIVGRPNVGKSTLVNALLGEERVIAFDMPGTTRDAIEIPFEKGDKSYTLIDTAGLRRRGKVFEAIEKFSVIKTLQAIEACNVVVLLLDAQADISDQDAHIAGFVVESGRAVVVVINKWDGLSAERRERVRKELEHKLRFLSFAQILTISALKGQGIPAVLRAVNAAHKAAFSKLSTPRLTRVLHDAVAQQPPPRKGIFRPKMRYAHQGGQNPPLIVVHGNALEGVSDSYKRYLEARFREVFKLDGTPLRIEFKSSHNPYVQGD